MDEEQAPVSSPAWGVVAAHERWAYKEGWLAGLNEGRRRGFDEGYGVGFDAGADLGAARVLAAVKVIVHTWSPDLLKQRCRRAGPASSRRQAREGKL